MRTDQYLNFNLDERPRLLYGLVVAITALALLMRLLKLGQWSFWVDEIITVNVALDVFKDGFIPGYLPPRGLSLLLIGAALKLGNVSEFTARLVPALLGALSVPLLFFPVRRIFGALTALVSVLLLTLSPWQLYWSQNARYVSALLLFYTLALLTFYIGLEENRPRYLLLSLVLFALAMWERLYGIFLLPIAGGYVALLFILPFFKKPAGLTRRNLALYFVPAIIIAFFFSQRFLAQPEGWTETFAREGAGPLTLLFQLLDFLTVPIVGMAAVTALYFLFVRRTRASLFVSLAAAVPLVGVMAASLVQFVDIRYAFVALMGVFILVGMGLSELASSSENKTKLLVGGVLLVFIIEPLIVDLNYYRSSNTLWPDWRQAFAYVEQQRQAGDWIATNKPPIGEYYLGEEEMITMDGSDERMTSEALLNSEQRIWFVEKVNLSRIGPELQAWVEANSNLVYETVGVKVYLYNPSQEVKNVP